MKAFPVLKSALSGLLIFQIIFGSTVLALPKHAYAADPKEESAGPPTSIVDQYIDEGSKDPATKAALAKDEAIAKELEESTEHSWPKQNTDFFHLNGQKLETVVKGAKGNEVVSIDLAALNIDLPNVGADFGKTVSVSVDRAEKTITLVHSERGAEKAWHSISGFDVVAYAMDIEMLQFVTADGKMYVIDMVFARHAAFKMPLPVIEVGNVDVSAFKKGTVRASFGTRGVRPPDVIPDKAVRPVDVEMKDLWTAGDFIVSVDRTDGKRELIGVYNRGVSQMQMYTGMATLSFLASMIAPIGGNDTLAQASAPIADPMVAASVEKALGKLDPQTRDFLAQLPKEYVEKLLARAMANKGRTGALRDRYSIDEWVEWFKKLHSKAVAEYQKIQSKGSKAIEKNRERYDALEQAIEIADHSADWQEVTKEEVKEAGKIQRSVFYRALHSKALKYLAYAAGTVGTAAAFLAIKDHTVTAESWRITTWAVHVANELYANYIPAVLKDASYRVTLLKSSLALSAFMPALYVVGSIYGKAKNWGFTKALAAIGIRIYAFLQKSFIVRAARIAGQPNFINALQLGLSPFAKIKADSQIGREAGLTKDVRPGFSFGFNKEKREADLRMKRKVLETVAVQKNRAKAYSWLLANMVVGERYGIDPATMLIAQTSGLDVDSTQKAREVMADKNFQQEWSKVAHELFFVMEDMKREGSIIDLSSIPKEQLEADIDLARKTAREIGGRSPLKAMSKELRIKWREAGSKVYRGVGEWGEEQYKFLSTVEPDKFVYGSTWKQFVIDYGLSIVQMGLIGQRAELDKPHNLAADPNGPLWTNKAHLGDMGEQVAIYGISVPASMAQLYQKIRQTVEPLYDPIEKITAEGVARPEGFMRGIGNWFKAAGNLRDANYGVFFVNALMKKMRSIQAAFALSFLSRTLLAHQGAGAAVSAFVFVTIWGNWAYGWLWAPINIGNDGYETKIAERDARFLEAKSILGQALRVDDPKQRDKGYELLKEIYFEHYKNEMPKQMRKDVMAVETLLAISDHDKLYRPAPDVPQRYINVAPDGEGYLEGENPKWSQDKQDAYDAWAEGRTELRNHLGAVARLSEALKAYEAFAPGARKEAAKAELWQAYGDLIKAYKGTEVEEQVKDLNARALLELAVQSPPFHNKPNAKVTWWSTMIGSLATTYWATSLFVTSYSPSALTFDAIMDITVKSGFIYAGLYVAQKIYNGVVDRMRAAKAKAKEKAAEAALIPEAQAEAPKKKPAKGSEATFEEFYENYVKERAAEFKVDPKDIEKAIDKNDMKVLRNHYETLKRVRKCEAQLVSDKPAPSQGEKTLEKMPDTQYLNDVITQ